MTKVRAFVNIIGEHVSGKPVSIGPRKVSDVKLTQPMKDAIDEGYAEIVNKGSRTVREKE